MFGCKAFIIHQLTKDLRKAYETIEEKDDLIHRLYITNNYLELKNKHLNNKITEMFGKDIEQ